jgi:hypothetical protein
MAFEFEPGFGVLEQAVNSASSASSKTIRGRIYFSFQVRLESGFELLGFNKELPYSLGAGENVDTSPTSCPVSSLSVNAWLGLVFRMGVDWLFFGHIFIGEFVACGERLNNSCDSPHFKTT